MGSLKPALCSMGALDYEDVPQQDELKDFVIEAFSHAEKLLNSLPNHASEAAEAPTDLKPPGGATKAIDTLVDSSTIPADVAPRGALADDQKRWGRPLKLNAKDNPLKVNVWKMAAHDKHGAWFARRSVHTGIGFERMKRCMQREFLESLKVKEGPGSGAVRGIAGDKRLAKQTVEGVGNVEVWQLSSAFPGPVTPREFVTMIITGENCLSLDSAPESTDKIPRGYVTISRPSRHAEAPPRSGLVLGTYESVEMVREIPLFPNEPDKNPVEWAMITRSEPGGGIPKFLVERGTPSSIVGDVAKWLQWAIDKGDLPQLTEEEEDAEVAAESSKDDQVEAKSAPTAGHAEDSQNSTATGTSSQPRRASASGNSGGPLGYLAMATSYVQEKASGYLPYFTSGRVSPGTSSDLTSSDEEDNDTASFRSFDEHSIAQKRLKSGGDAHDSEDATSIEAGTKDGKITSPSASTEALVANLEARSTGHLNSHERELLKLSEKRRQLDAKIAKSRAADEERAQTISSKEATIKQKAAERHERDVQRQEKRYREQLERLEKARAKEAQKIEDRRKKQEERDELRLHKTQRDEWKERCKVVEQENDILRRQVESLQRENTVMAAGLGEMGPGGQDIMRRARQESLGDRVSSKSRVSLETHDSETSVTASAKSSVRADADSTKSAPH